MIPETEARAVAICLMVLLGPFIITFVYAIIGTCNLFRTKDRQWPK